MSKDVRSSVVRTGQENGNTQTWYSRTMVTRDPAAGRQAFPMHLRHAERWKRHATLRKHESVHQKDPEDVNLWRPT